jgi:hypothetical protein
MKHFIILLALFLLFSPAIQAQSEEHIWKRVTQTRPQQLIDSLKIDETKISAVVGYGIFTIEGYTSPEAKVKLTSSQANLGSQQTKADKNGFFRFSNIILPGQPGELWLQATDSQELTGPPVAIPEPPPGIEKIENILLPPTLAHSKGFFRKGSRSLAFGQTIPNSQVEIYLFEDQDISWFKKLLLTLPLPSKKAQAQEETLFSVSNKLTLKTGEDGYFSFDLPNQKNQLFRYYAGSVYRENYSPKSNTLSFRVLSLIEALYQQMLFLADKILASIFGFLKDLIFWIFLEIVALVLLAKKYQKTYG